MSRRHKKGWVPQEVSLMVRGVGVVFTIHAPKGSPDWLLLKLAKRRLGFDE